MSDSFSPRVSNFKSSSKVFVTTNALFLSIAYLLDIEHRGAHARSIYSTMKYTHESARAPRESRMLIICPLLASRKNNSRCAVYALRLSFYLHLLEFIEQDAVRNKWKLRSGVRRSFAWTKTRDHARYNLRSSQVN